MTTTNRTETNRTWTAEEIEELFQQSEKELDDANREATKGPFNPFGDSSDSLVWFGTIEELWEVYHHRQSIIDSINQAREDAVAVGEEYEELDPSDIDGSEIEELRAEIDRALLGYQKVIGTGNPIFLATQEGYPTVFCEHASAEAVGLAIEEFYASDPDVDEDEDDS